MRFRRRLPEETVQAILAGRVPEGADDLARLAQFVGQLRAAADATPLPARRGELRAFMAQLAAPDRAEQVLTAAAPSNLPDAVPEWRGPLTRRKSAVLSGLSTFLATLTGKVVLGGAIAAASVGALHASHVVDVPGLPSGDSPAGVQTSTTHGPSDTTTPEGEELPEEAVRGQQHAAEHRAAVEAYTGAVRDWTRCVAEHASARGETQRDETTRVTGPFDPREACGEHPNPHDFGLSEPPDHASGRGRSGAERPSAEKGGGPPEGGPPGQSRTEGSAPPRGAGHADAHGDAEHPHGPPESVPRTDRPGTGDGSGTRGSGTTP